MVFKAGKRPVERRGKLAIGVSRARMVSSDEGKAESGIAITFVPLKSRKVVTKGTGVGMSGKLVEEQSIFVPKHEHKPA